MANSIYNMEVQINADGKGLFATAKKVSNAVKGLNKQKVAVGTSNSDKDMKALDKAIQTTEKEVDRLTRKQESLKKQHVNTNQYKQLQKEAAATQDRIAKLNQMYGMLREQSQNVGWYDPQLVRSMTDLENETVNADNRLKELQGQMAAIATNGTTEKEAAEWRRVSTDLAAAKTRLSEYNSQKVAASTGNPPASPWERIKAALAGVGSRAKTTGKNMIHAVGGGVRGAVSKLGAAFSGLAKKISGTHNPLKKMKRGLMMGTGIKGLARLGMAGASVYMMVRFLKEGFKNLAQYSPQVNNSLSMLQTALLKLKNALATAFAPILNVIAPYLAAFINWISKALTAVGHFFAALTGQKAVVVAKKATTNFAESVKETGNQADKTRKKQKKLNRVLMGFDQINKLESQKDKSSDNSGNSGYQAPTPSQMFSTEAVSKEAKGWVKSLKKMWAKADFSALGRMIGNKLNKALGSINWAVIKKTAAKIASSIVTFLNGFIKATNWQLVGKTIAEGLNTAVTFLETAFRKLDWKAVGVAVADTLIGFFKSINWGKAAKTLSNLIVGIGKTAIGFMERINWQAAGKGLIKAIRDMIKNIDWGAMLANSFRFAGNIIGAFAGLAVGIAKGIGQAVKKGIAGAGRFFQKRIKKMGGNIPLGILLGIVDAIKGIGSWIKKHIFSPFIKGFKKAFGIHSPSKKMAKQGKNIVLGLVKGLASNIGAIFNWFKKLPGKIWKLIKKAGSFVINVSVGLIKNAKEWAADAWKAVSSAGQKVKTTVVSALKKASKWSKDAFRALKVGGKTIHKALIQSVKKGTWKNVAWKAATTLGRTVHKALVQAVKKAKSWSNKAWAAATTAGNTIKKVLKIGVEWVGKGLKAAWNLLTGGGSTAFKKGARGKLKGRKASGGVYKHGSWHPVTTAATGGAFNQGQMFVAREAGPELVGTIGGNTAVMNNDQIVASVSAGVAKAVASVMRNSGDQDVNVYLMGDAEKLFTVMRGQAKAYTMATGKAAFPG